MSEKKCFWLILLVQIFSLSLIMFMLIIIDPLEIWDIKSIQGWNHYKVEQVNHFDLSKTYQYIYSDAETVYIGASTTYVGLKPTNDRIFNFGLSSLTLQDTREYLNFIFRLKKPKKIILELNAWQFTKEAYQFNRLGFSKERLELLAKGGVIQFSEKIKETLSTHKLVFNTVQQSRKNKNLAPMFIRGWDVSRGAASKPDERSYLYYLNSKLKASKTDEFEPQLLDVLRNIIELIEKNEVEVIVFWAPISIDNLVTIDASNKFEDFYNLKKNVAEIYPNYDFAWANEIAINRQLFYDGWHYRAVAGDIVLGVLECKIPPDGLATNNYEEQKLAYEKWKEKKENSEYVELLKNAKEKIPDDVLKKHLNLE